MAKRLLSKDEIVEELHKLDDVEGQKAGYYVGDLEIVRKIDCKGVSYCTADLFMTMEDFSDRILRPLIISPRRDGAAPLPPEQVRGGTHGDYTQMAITAQNIKIAMRAGTNWDSLTPVKTEALHMMATKLARIVCGDSDCHDHWVDIAGYANLVKDRIAVPHKRGKE